MIPISRTSFDESDFAAVVEPLRKGWVVQGEYVRRFESQFAAFTGQPHAIATSSCTTALQLCLAALGIGAGDEVLVPAFTWIATANAVEHAGATPVFVDIDTATFTLDPVHLASRITDRTRAILPVHQFGHPADMDRVMALARQHDLRVIEDAACGFGTTWHGAHVGGLGDAGCFSFHPRKAITTGEGGMITTSAATLDARCRALRDHGAVRASSTAAPFILPDFPYAGFNFRLTDIQGALGCTQMDKAAWILGRRRHCAARYDALLADCPWLQRPVTAPGAGHSYQAYVVLFAPETPTAANVALLSEQRNAVMAQLEAQGIGTRQGTHSLPHTSYYARRYDIAADAFPQSKIAESLSIALPLYPDMTDDDIALVAEALQAAVAAQGV